MKLENVEKILSDLPDKDVRLIRHAAHMVGGDDQRPLVIMVMLYLTGAAAGRCGAVQIDAVEVIDVTGTGGMLN